MTTAVPLWAIIVDQVAEQRLSYRPADDPIDQISDMYRESMLNDNIIKIIKYNPVKDMSILAHAFITAQSVAITGPEAVDLLAAVPEALVDPWDNIQDLMGFCVNLTNPQAGFGGTDPVSTIQFFDSTEMFFQFQGRCHGGVDQFQGRCHGCHETKSCVEDTA